MKKILFLSLVILANGVLAQSYVKARAIVANPNSCNNTIVCEFYNMDYPNYVKYGMFGPDVEHQDTIQDVCFYDAGSMTSGTLDGFIGNGYMSAYMLQSSVILPDFNFTLSSYVEPTSTTSQDGSFVVEFDSAVTMFTIDVTQEDGYVPTITTPDANTLELSNLNKGYIIIYIQDPGDVYNYTIFRVYAGDASEYIVNEGMDVNVSFQHPTSSACDGWINLQANPPGTYYNAWSDGTANNIARTNLCPGVYGVYSYNLISGYADVGHIDTVVLVDNGLTYIDTNLYSLTPEDTSYYFFEDCLFDFGLPIDSAHYTEDTIFYADPLLIATYEMTLFQGSSMVTISDSLITLADSTVLLDVVIYCTQFKSQFMGQRIMFLRGADDHYFDAPFLGTPESEMSLATVFPNPVRDQLNVQFAEFGTYTIQVIDYQGNQVQTLQVSNDNQVQLQTENLASGIYLLLVHSENGVEQHRFVKTTY